MTEPEYPTLAALVKYAKPDKVFVDIGAHHGLFSIEMAKRSMLVYAVEPFPPNFVQLHKNIDAAQVHVKVFPYAVTDATGTAMLYNGGPSTVHSLEPGIAADMFDQPENLPEPEYVPTINWGDLCHQAKLTEVEILKTDAKWSNLKVLKGMIRGVVLPRVICTEQRPADTVEIEKLLLSVGYVFREQIMLDGTRNIFDAIWERE